MDPIATTHTLLLLVVANSAPVFASYLFGNLFCRPIDGGIFFPDGRRILGPTKTFRGVLASIFATAITSQLLRSSWDFGAVIAALSMTGDLLSSFVKRRLKMEPSTKLVGFDQGLESIMPMFYVKEVIGLTWADVLIVLVLFFFGSLLGSRLLYAVKIKNRPY